MAIVVISLVDFIGHPKMGQDLPPFHFFPYFCKKNTAEMELTVSHIYKSYKGKVALIDVSIQLREGAILGLLGPNGAGKTTLLRSITGITQVDSGEILLDRVPIDEKSRRGIGYLPEERGLYPDMKVGEQLVYLAQLKGMTRNKAKEAVREWLQKFQILNTIEKKTHELSKGMQQKVQFIAAVIHSPQLLILDEPFSGFDPINTEVIKNEILRLKGEGVGIILSTHNMTSVEELCDEVALINQAHIVLNGPTEELRERYKCGEFRLSGFANKAIEVNETPSSYFREKGDGSWIVTKKEKTTDNNTLLKELMELFSITAFEEIKPSMNEIFLKAVNPQ